MDIIETIERKTAQEQYEWACSTETLVSIQNILDNIGCQIEPNIFASAWIISWSPTAYRESIVNTAQNVCFLYKFMISKETSDKDKVFVGKSVKLALEKFNTSFNTWKKLEEFAINNKVKNYYKELSTTPELSAELLTHKTKMQEWILEHESQEFLDKLDEDIIKNNSEEKMNYWELMAVQLLKSPPEMMMFTIIINEIKERTLQILPRDIEKSDLTKNYINFFEKFETTNPKISDIRAIMFIQIDTLMGFQYSEENKEKLVTWSDKIKIIPTDIWTAPLTDTAVAQFVDFARTTLTRVKDLSEEILDLVQTIKTTNNVEIAE